jgi:predicted phosphodiesterase
VYREGVRVLLLSDIHSNLVALEAVLAACPDADAVWCLGDIVGYGPRPNEVIARLASLGAASVAGNHDLAALGKLDTLEFNPSAANAARWTQQVLDASSRAYLANLPTVAVQADFTLVHGSPRDPTWEYVMESRQAEANAAHYSTRVCLFGHTHLPSAFVERSDGLFGSTVAQEGDVLELQTLPG